MRARRVWEAVGHELEPGPAWWAWQEWGEPGGTC